jgi:hypothetical protein
VRQSIGRMGRPITRSPRVKPVMSASTKLDVTQEGEPVLQMPGKPGSLSWW